MKVILMSMPDVAPMIIHHSAIHMPGHGIASVGGNIDDHHEVYIVDLIRERRKLRRYVTRIITRIQPDLVGLSAMAWQYDTCVRLIRLIKQLRPTVKIVIGGYHATLMSEEIAASEEARWIDFMIRGEGEEACRRLVNALADEDDIRAIPSLSYKENGVFVHNPRSENLDLAALKLPIRDKRRLTWGYHIMYSRIELMETSRGCTRNCNYCSMKHMYGRSFRVFPLERVLSDLDDIYHNRKTRWVFIVDDNLVLDPGRVIELCDAIIARKYRNLNIVVQADCLTMAREEEMVRKMALAGFKSVFLGIENASQKNLEAAQKGNIVDASRKAVANCHKYGIMVIGGLIFGFPDDDETAIIENYRFLNDIQTDAAYVQILTPYPKTGMRQKLIDQGLVANRTDYKRYNGLWANVRTRHLEAEDLQYLFWYHRQNVLGWWDPTRRTRDQGKLWTAIWVYAFKPFLKRHYERLVRKVGWKALYKKDMEALAELNRFRDLDH
ncbi:MAG: B12-binding domain-containing radical SAM protein [Thermodesulfobacteriota bacterium]